MGSNSYPRPQSNMIEGKKYQNELDLQSVRFFDKPNFPALFSKLSEIFTDSRGKNILEQLLRSLFFTEFEIPALFPAGKKRAVFSNPIKDRVLESCSKLFFPLVILISFFPYGLYYLLTFVPLIWGEIYFADFRENLRFRFLKVIPTPISLRTVQIRRFIFKK